MVNLLIQQVMECLKKLTKKVKGGEVKNRRDLNRTQNLRNNKKLKLYLSLVCLTKRNRIGDSP